MDVVGGCNIKHFYGSQALSIFIMPPSIEELRNRLESRGTDSIETINARIAKAEQEMTYAPQFDVIIKNDNLEEAKEKAIKVVTEFLGK